MTMVGMFHEGRKGFPKELKAPEKLHSSTIFYEKEGLLNLTQYTVKSKRNGKVGWKN